MWPWTLETAQPLSETVVSSASFGDESTSSSHLRISEETGKDHAEPFKPGWLMKESFSPSFLLGTGRSTTPTWVETNEELNTFLAEAGKSSWLMAAGVVKLAPGRGDDERAHWCLKEFGTEKLPFKDFEPNTAFYYIMVFSLNLEKAFKRDVTTEQIRPVCYPSTFKRKFIDVVGKVVSARREIILKVTRAVWNRLNVPEVWERVNSTPVPILSAI